MNPHDFVYKSIFSECKKKLNNDEYCQHLAQEALSKYKMGLFKKVKDLVKGAVAQAEKQANIDKSLKGEK